MQYRQDPKSGNNLSALGFGCMRLPSSTLGRIDLEASEALVLQAVEQGINYFDTAYLYRGNEEALGIIVERNDLRNRIFIATKLPHSRCETLEDIERFFAEQKARLRTDYFDYYLIHNVTNLTQWDKLVALGIEEWIDRKKRAGEIRQIGFSYHGSQSDFPHLIDAYAWDFCQIQYNYVNVNYQAGRAGLELAASRGLPVIIMEPLLGGKLADGLPPKAVEAFKRCDPTTAPAAWGLRWIWNHPQATVVLSGMGTLEQLTENVACAEHALPNALSDDELACIDDVVDIFDESNKVNCTGCNYCMPCPRGINIPGCFSAYNASFTHGRYEGLKQYVMCTGAGSNDPRWASDCVDCGACVKNCPQHIAIPDELKAVRKRLQPALFPRIIRLGSKLMG